MGEGRFEPETYRTHITKLTSFEDVQLKQPRIHFIRFLIISSSMTYVNISMQFHRVHVYMVLIFSPLRKIARAFY